MDVNQVRFGNYSIGNPQGGAPKKSEANASETQTQSQQNQGAQKFSVEEMFNAMNIAGMQNMVHINRAEAKAVNPADYLDERRISDIEAMMAEFESGVGEIANTIEAEFPGMFAQDQKNALAAEIFAAE